jgi:hypothetical protein
MSLVSVILIDFCLKYRQVQVGTASTLNVRRGGSVQSMISLRRSTKRRFAAGHKWSTLGRPGIGGVLATGPWSARNSSLMA